MFIREYAASLWADWVALMSGLASVALAFWAAYLPPANVQAGRTLLWITAVLCFVVASYRIWAREHKASLTKQSELERIIAEKDSWLTNKARRDETVTRLDELRVRGRVLLASLKKEDQPIPAQEIIDWRNEVIDFLKAGLDGGLSYANEYVCCVEELPKGYISSSSAHSHEYSNIYPRIKKLDEIISGVRGGSIQPSQNVGSTPSS